MKIVKTQQKYKCDFCKKRSTKSVIEIHEKRCFRNPNRFCTNCNNTGKQIITDFGDEQDCFYCAKFDPKMLKEIEEREKTNNGKLPDTTIEFEVGDIPF